MGCLIIKILRISNETKGVFLMKIEIDGIAFPITIDLSNAQIHGLVPAEVVLREIRPEVDKYDGYKIKDTKFNRWRVNDIDLEGIIPGGVRVRVSINLKHRELLFKNPITGKRHYGPWVSVTLNGTADFAVSIKQNTVDVDYRSHNIKGQKWYSEIIEVLANDLFKSHVAKMIDKGISPFDGVSIASFLKQGQVLDSGGITIPLDTLLNNVSASANLVPQGVNFIIKLPKNIVIS
jgi:hypothetical protein